MCHYITDIKTIGLTIAADAGLQGTSRIEKGSINVGNVSETEKVKASFIFGDRVQIGIQDPIHLKSVQKSKDLWKDEIYEVCMYIHVLSIYSGLSQVIE